MSSYAQRILILSSRTGGGHQSAAFALEESFLRLSTGRAWVGIQQVLEEAHFISRRLAGFYNYLLRNHQHWMKYYYWAIEQMKPYQNHMLLQLCTRYGTQMLEKVAPTTLVSVHPMIQHMFAYLLRKLNLLNKIPLITVVTDPYPDFWQGWACPDVSQYFVASDGARDQLIEYGISPEKIDIIGMPVHAKFQPLPTEAEKLSLRQQLQLSPERFTILVNAGWAGGGNIPDLYKTLIHQAPENSQLVFIAGTNDDLRRHTEEMARNSIIPVQVLGFTQDLHLYMNAADVMFSKLGGLTTFEAMACQLPILADCLTPPMPQEAGTARYIEDKGAGILIKTPNQAIDELHRLIQAPHDYQRMKSAAKAIGRPGAVDHIAMKILQQESVQNYSNN